MSGSDDARHRQVVERLRDVTRNRDALLATASEDLPRAGVPLRRAADARARDTYGTVRPMEDAALTAIAAVYFPACDFDAVRRAIDDAGASWLYSVMLDRALASTGGKLGDA